MNKAKVTVYRGYCGGWQVRLAIDHQSFDVGMEREKPKEAKWLARQLRVALKRLTTGRP